jgi:hypothetical protein
MTGIATNLTFKNMIMQNRYQKGVQLALLCLFLLLELPCTFSAALPVPEAPPGAKPSPPQAKPTPAPPAAAPATAPSVIAPRILGIKIDGNESTYSGQATVIRTDNIIRIVINNPKEFLSQRPFDHSDLILYANGIPLKGMTTTYFTTMSAQDLADPAKKWPDSLEIPFVFKKDTSNRDAWNSLFHLAGIRENRISFKLSMGWSGMFPLTYAGRSAQGRPITLVFYTMRAFYILLALYLAFILYFIYLCHSTGLIREPDRVTKQPGPYSLAQTQLAFWTVIVLGGFIYLILLTGFSDSLNDSILLLLGITGSTTGVASFIDYYKKGTAMSNMPADTPAAAIATRQHVSFLTDILSDGINISVQRTQTFLWNLVLGIYFIIYVISNKSMPVFDNTLLVLAGVSSVLYLTSKGPENPSPPPSGPQQDANPPAGQNPPPEPEAPAAPAADIPGEQEPAPPPAPPSVPEEPPAPTSDEE